MTRNLFVITSIATVGVGLFLGKTWQMFYTNRVLGTSTVLLSQATRGGGSEGGQGAGGQQNPQPTSTSLPTSVPIPTSIPLPTTPPQQPPAGQSPLGDAPPIFAKPSDGSAPIPIDPGVDIDVEILTPESPSQQQTTTPSAPIPTPQPTSAPIPQIVQNIVYTAIKSVSLGIPQDITADQDTTVLVNESALPPALRSLTQQNHFLSTPYISIEKVNINGIPKIKIIVHARLSDGRRILVQDDILEIIKKRLALYDISVGLAGEQAFYIEHGTIDQTPARATTRYPLSFDLVQNRVQVVTPEGVKPVNILPDTIAQDLIYSNNASRVETDAPFTLTLEGGDLKYIVRGVLCKNFAGLFPVCLGRVLITSATSARSTEEPVIVHQSLLSHIIDLGSL